MNAQITEQAIQMVAGYAMDFIFALFLGILIRYGVPFIKSKTEASDLAYIKEVVKDAVASAEERFIGPKLGLSVRKPWVVDLLTNMDIAVDQFIEAMIDAAARSLTEATKIAEAAATAAVLEATDGRVTAESAVKTVTVLEDAIKTEGTV